jgi:hypothetical protein
MWEILKIRFDLKILALLHSAPASFNWNSIYNIWLHGRNLCILMQIITLCHIFSKRTAWARHSIYICIFFFIILHLNLVLLFFPHFFLIFTDLILFNIALIFKSIDIANLYWFEWWSFNYRRNLFFFILNIFFLLEVIL